MAERGLGVLLVEHDMALVQQTCAHVYVLDYGSMIFEGTAQQMLTADSVRAAYLGVSTTEPASYRAAGSRRDRDERDRAADRGVQADGDLVEEAVRRRGAGGLEDRPKPGKPRS